MFSYNSFHLENIMSQTCFINEKAFKQNISQRTSDLSNGPHRFFKKKTLTRETKIKPKTNKRHQTTYKQMEKQRRRKAYLGQRAQTISSWFRRNLADFSLGWVVVIRIDQKVLLPSTLTQVHRFPRKQRLHWWCSGLSVEAWRHVMGWCGGGVCRPVECRG